jgi:hypothetical protein
MKEAILEPQVLTLRPQTRTVASIVLLVVYVADIIIHRIFMHPELMDTMDVVETIAANAMKHAVSIPKISIKN